MTWMDEDGTIHHVRGDTFSLTMTEVKDSDGDLIVWSNYKMSLIVKSDPNNEDSVLDFSEEDGIDLTTPGLILIKKDTDEIELATEVYYYDWKVINPSNEIDTWIHQAKLIVE
jgi:hypothetical protein